MSPLWNRTLVYPAIGVLEITWLSDANYAQTTGDGRMNWNTAMAWAAGLSYGGYDDWRLPTALNQDNSGPCIGYCTGSEMSHMFYTNLGGTSGNSILSASDPNNYLDLFTDVQPHYCWSGTEYAPPTDDAWSFSTHYGYQDYNFKSYEFYAWAVRSGGVASVPLPAAVWLFGAGLAGLGVFGRTKGRR